LVWKYGKMIFLKLIFKETFIYLKMSFNILTVELCYHDHPLDGTQLVVLAGLPAGVVASHLHS